MSMNAQYLISVCTSSCVVNMSSSDLDDGVLDADGTRLWSDIRIRHNAETGHSF